MSDNPNAATREQRWSALGQDALLFCGAFSVGAMVFALLSVVGLLDAFNELGTDYWSVGLSSELVLSGLVAGEFFMLWNNGIRQGVRGHSIGKHRMGIEVVDTATGKPSGAARGLLRGFILVVLLDLAIAAIPVGLPTLLRTFTPEAIRFGGAAYLALAVLVIPLLLRSRRGFADLLARTEVLQARADDGLAVGRQRVLVALDVLSVLGVIAVAVNYIAFYAPLFFRFPSFF